MSELTVTEYKNIRVLTTQQIAEAYGTDTKVVSYNFNHNKDRYVDGKHYICLTGDELRAFRENHDLPSNLNKLYLWTEKGAFLHAKSLNTDRAWEVYDRLVDEYFEKPKLPSWTMDDKIQILAQGNIELKEKIEAVNDDLQEFKMNSVVLKRKFTGKPATMPYSAAKLERMQRMFDESREKVLVARNEEIEKAYQKGKEDGISRTVSVLNKVVENAREEEREKSYNAGFEQGFTDGQDWANVENSVTLLLALHRAYDFEPEQLMNVVEKSNKYVHQANEGKPTIGTLARQLYNECQIKLCEHEVEILRKYSLFEEGDPYD